jgi:hypothetical protein
MCPLPVGSSGEDGQHLQDDHCDAHAAVPAPHCQQSHGQDGTDGVTDHVDDLRKLVPGLLEGLEEDGTKASR